MQRGQTSKLAFLSRKTALLPVSLCTIWVREGNVDDLNSFENKCSERGYRTDKVNLKDTIMFVKNWTIIPVYRQTLNILVSVA